MADMAHSMANVDHRDVLFESIADRDRRRLLLALAESEPEDEIDVDEFVAVHADRSESLGIELHHVHLPKLEHADLVDWDRETRTIRTGPRFHELRPQLERLMEA